MALDLSALTKGLNPIGMGLSVLGGVGNIIGAAGQKKEAKRQLADFRTFAGTQRSALQAGQADVMAKAKALPTYQMDLTKFAQAQQAAELGKMQASAGRVAGEDLAREQVRQTTANTLAAAQRGAMSATDLLTSALFAQGQEGAQMRDITQSSMQQRQAMQQQAQQNYLASLGQTAAAEAQQRGIQFESELQKAQNILGLSQQQLGQTMDFESNMFAQDQAKAAALQNARAAIWSGIGGLASGIGGGLMNLQAQNDNMSMLQSIYGGGTKPVIDGSATAAGQAAQQTIGSGAKLGQVLGQPASIQMQKLPTTPINKLGTNNTPYYSNYQGSLNRVFGF